MPALVIGRVCFPDNTGNYSIRVSCLALLMVRVSLITLLVERVSLLTLLSTKVSLLTLGTLRHLLHLWQRVQWILHKTES
jgi:hypothetical protein